MITNQLVSIIMAAYNAEKYISEAIQSVLNQSYKHWELIVVNDGSTDTTKSIIDSFDDSRIVYLEQSNRGVSAARNLGLSVMKGEFFCILDADDIMPPKSVESRITLFNDPNIYFVDGKVIQFRYEEINIIRTFLPTIKQINPFDSLIALDGSCFMVPSWMMRNTNQIKPFREGLTHGEDLVFYIDNAEQGNYTYTDELILRYRRTDNSAMSNLDGLYEGYKTMFSILKSKNIDKDKLQRFYQKSKSIMVKSYLKNKSFLKALKVLFT